MHDVPNYNFSLKGDHSGIMSVGKKENNEFGWGKKRKKKKT